MMHGQKNIKLDYRFFVIHKKFHDSVFDKIDFYSNKFSIKSPVRYTVAEGVASSCCDCGNPKGALPGEAVA